jgi:hypothetical protein
MGWFFPMSVSMYIKMRLTFFSFFFSIIMFQAKSIITLTLIHFEQKLILTIQ